MKLTNTTFLIFMASFLTCCMSHNYRKRTLFHKINLINASHSSILYRKAVKFDSQEELLYYISLLVSNWRKVFDQKFKIIFRKVSLFENYVTLQVVNIHIINTLWLTLLDFQIPYYLPMEKKTSNMWTTGRCPDAINNMHINVSVLVSWHHKV